MSKSGSLDNKVYIRNMNQLKRTLQENKCLSEKQKKVLTVLLESDMYFISYCFDQDWDLMYSECKTILVQNLFDGNWKMGWMEAYCEDHIYAIQFMLEESKRIRDFAPYVLTNHIDESYISIEVYISPTGFAEIKKIID
ncbi:hypothetical protein P9027_29765 [Bacillus thuringiensis]|uniref:hypothetical protein n=1 Tax=Bacillus thuringiensis TaxID=1428 RepID=UPI002DBD016D|nr:hypothetical protein [Bacillus thuringiensis]MEC3226108.1 hypothetical protein [Bacillus thuringiensis]MEC3463190.1 hypothetical protein [Bacillus thuringiensis]MEC3555389.1 hypothetical protein [Bacillus thuringiensis]MED2058874.1 hypothetical protein [Bacillus thuringiensis]